MANTVQRAFTVGEVSPSLYTGVDKSYYAAAVRQMRNFIIQKEGGAYNRPGFDLVARTKADQSGRLIKFVSSDNDADKYVMEFGNKYIRFHQNGAPLTVNPGFWVTATAYSVGDTVVGSDSAVYYCILAHTSGASTHPITGTNWATNWYRLPTSTLEIPTPYLNTDLSGLQYVQVKNQMRFVHPSYPVYELTRITPVKWTFLPVVFGPAIAPPTNLLAAGGVAGGPTWWAVTSVDDTTGEESLTAVVEDATHKPDATTPEVLSWTLVSGVKRYNVYRSSDGATFAFIGFTGGVNLSSATNTTWTTNSDTLTQGSTFGVFVQSGGQARITVLTVASDKSTAGQYHVFGAFSLDAQDLGGTPLTVLGRLRAFYKRDAETRVDAGIVYGPVEIDGVGSISLTPIDFIVNVPDNGYSTLVIDIVPELSSTSVGPAVAFDCTIDETTAPQNRVDWNKAGTGFKDTNMLADPTTTPPVQQNFFAQPGDYPSVITEYQQREILAATLNNSGQIWCSRIGSPKNFALPQPLTDNDPIIFEMTSRYVVNVKHAIDLTRLIVFTGVEEKIIDGEVQSGILKPDAINVRSHSRNGSNFLRPIIANNRALFIQARGNQVRMLQYDNVGDPINIDLSLTAKHLLQRRTLVDWDYAQVPDSIFWMVRSDGELIGMTLEQQQGTLGWHHHDTEGFFESVCVIPEGNEDRVYALIRRTLTALGEVRTIERMCLPALKDVTDFRDCAYVDCGAVVWDGRNVLDPTALMTLSGGVQWLPSETLTMTVTGGNGGTNFSPGSVGGTVLLVSAVGELVYVLITAYLTVKSVSVQPLSVVPESLQAIGTSDFSTCSAVPPSTLVSHLAGMNVTIYADGNVVANPNNPQYPLVSVPLAGAPFALSQAYAVIRVGLPYISDLETLDIDSVTPTRKTSKISVSRVVLSLVNSRGLWIGQSDTPTAANPLQGLDEFKIRDLEAWCSPVALLTDDVDVPTTAHYTRHGRIFIRQVDPLPTIISMIAPVFDET